MTVFKKNDEYWMREALQEAQKAACKDEVPVGAVLVCGDQIIGRGHDQKVSLADPTAHAEILAMREAAQTLGDWRLEDCTLCVTLEPCPMYARAILLTRVPRLVYGARNHKFGAVESITSLFNAELEWNHNVKTVSGVLAEESSALLTKYFSAKREKKD